MATAAAAVLVDLVVQVKLEIADVDIPRRGPGIDEIVSADTQVRVGAGTDAAGVAGGERGGGEQQGDLFGGFDKALHLQFPLQCAATSVNTSRML